MPYTYYIIINPDIHMVLREKYDSANNLIFIAWKTFYITNLYVFPIVPREYIVLSQVNKPFWINNWNLELAIIGKNKLYFSIILK